MLKKILKFSLYALIFFLPLFWLPFSFEFIEFNKLYLLFFLGWMTVLIWFLKMILVDKVIKIRWSRFDFLVLAFILISVISFAFSPDKPSGLFGSYGRFNNGLIALLSFFALYILVRNNFSLGEEKNEIEEKKEEEKKEKKESGEVEGIKWTKLIKAKIKGAKGGEVITLEGIFNSLFFSALIVVLWSCLSLFNVWSKIPFLRGRTPFVFSPVSGSAYGLAVYLALMMVLVLLALLTRKGLKTTWVVLYGSFLVLAGALLLLFDFSSAWIVLGVSLILFIGLSLKKKILKEEVHRLIIPIFLVLLSALFLVLSFEGLLAGFGRRDLPIFDFPREQILWQDESWQIGINSVTHDAKNRYIGSGIGTFLYDFSKFKSDRMNQGLLWQLRFDRSGNNIAEILATEGFFGLIVFLLIIGWLFVNLMWKKEKDKEESKEDKTNKIILGVILAGLVVSQLVFYQNMVLGALFWLTLGIGASISFTKEKKFSLREYPEIGLIFETVTIILVLLIVAGYFFGIKFYLADYNYTRSLYEPDLDKKISMLQRASALNPYQPYYQMVTSQALLSRLQQELSKPQKEQDKNLLTTYVSLSLDLYAKNAARIAPGQITAWQNLANIYRDLVGLAEGADKWGIKTYSRAIELEPKNPILYTERGKIYLFQNKIEEAKNDFQKAIELAPNYPDPQIQMALTEEREGKTKEAINRLEELVNTFPFNFNINALFHLGRLYYNDDQIDKSIETLGRAITLSPNHSNSLYTLALAYQKKGNIKESIKLLEKVLELNPENQEVRDKIKELKGEVKEEE
jgi:tetratricopeptide (TPR) repeat protein